MTGRGRRRGGPPAAASSASANPTSAPTGRRNRRRSKQARDATRENAMPPPPSGMKTRSLRSRSRSKSRDFAPSMEIPRRGTRRDAREKSVASLNTNFTRQSSTDIYSDYPAPESQSKQIFHRGRVFHAPTPDLKIPSKICPLSSKPVRPPPCPDSRQLALPRMPPSNRRRLARLRLSRWLALDS
jgi:hypothetical protein